MTVVPTISELIHHIKRCPIEFLKAPVLNGRGDVYTEALLNDALRLISRDSTAPATIFISADKRSNAELTLMQICCWAVSHPFFAQIDSDWFAPFFSEGLSKIAPLVKTELWVKDEERAEELARILLNACACVPGGETAAEAKDRFDSVDTIKRLQVIEETRASYVRASEIRRRMAEAKAREAANVYARE